MHGMQERLPQQENPTGPLQVQMNLPLNSHSNFGKLVFFVVFFLLLFGRAFCPQRKQESSPALPQELYHLQHNITCSFAGGGGGRGTGNRTIDRTRGYPPKKARDQRLGYPTVPVGRHTRVKTVPPRRTSYAGDKNIEINVYWLEMWQISL